MTSTKFRSDEERSILTACIVNHRVLAKVSSKFKETDDPFRSKWGNIVFRWCFKFYQKYQKAPRGIIRNLFRRYAEKSKDEATVEILEKFLSGLSDDYVGLSKELNVDFLVDQAAAYFNRVRCERLRDLLDDDLNSGDSEEALKRVDSFHRVELSTDSAVDVFTDREAIADAIDVEQNETLIQYPGALGEFFGPHLERDGFISFLAPEKRGKSFVLIDVAWRAAVLNKRKTLFYSVGDMSQRQMMKRLIVRAARRPVTAGTISWPRAVRVVGKDPQVKFKHAEFDSRMTVKEARQAMKMIQVKTAHTSSLLKLKCTPNSSTSVADIEADIDGYIQDGWVPDVLVIDYADILAPEPGTTGDDPRHRVDGNWKALRRLSQKYHILVVTATQSNALSYDSTVLRRTHFSEDKRKLSHVTGMVGINQTEEEKRLGVFRLNWILLREGTYYESKCVTVAGSLALSNPAIKSTW